MKKILIVEDNHDIVEILKMALEKENYEIYVAYDGIEALNKVKSNKPDLIVLDIMLPKLDGHSVNLRLKEDTGTKNIPVVVITGRGHLKELLDIREDVTVSAYLEKPFPIRLLMDKIAEIFKSLG